MFAQVAVPAAASVFINTSETEVPELGQVVGHVRHHGRAWACCLGLVERGFYPHFFTPLEMAK